MVNIAIFKPVRVAMNTSPVEGARYLAYSGKAKVSSKLHRKLSPNNLAKINIQRNRQKAILTLVMLGVSGALLLGASTVAGSIDPEKQAAFKYYPAGSILLQVKITLEVRLIKNLSRMEVQNCNWKKTRLKVKHCGTT